MSALRAVSIRPDARRSYSLLCLVSAFTTDESVGRELRFAMIPSPASTLLLGQSVEPLVLAADNSAAIGGASVLEADELALIGRVPFPNALLIGSYERVGALLTALTPRLQGPILRRDHFLEESIHTLERGTLVLWSVDRLESAGQGTLLRFVNDRLDVQIISVATTSLFEQVQRGAFPEALYYRLNDVLIDVNVLSH